MSVASGMLIPHPSAILSDRLSPEPPPPPPPDVPDPPGCLLDVIDVGFTEVVDDVLDGASSVADSGDGHCAAGVGAATGLTGPGRVMTVTL
ncbi:hypothetical protein GP486_007476 [Trichoglossum hirsutum]|uniref:Uncharacterized protein n=1 Tax=Trichoglossum hirsutum TaxID=265104 RepID=A0A9P8L6U4_9PEZI|nr:hypothetical protein GP486_007476 [Trichoglossum hirsutum]